MKNDVVDESQRYSLTKLNFTYMGQFLIYSSKFPENETHGVYAQFCFELHIFSKNY